MRKKLAILILTVIAFYSCGQSQKTIADKEANEIKIVDTDNRYESILKTKGFAKDSYIYTEASYIDSTGKGIIIENGLPKGGAFTIAANEKIYGYAVFWTRLINKEDKTLDLMLSFPSDSIVFVPSSNVHFKLLLPPDTLTLDKLSTFNYGLKDVQSFVDENFYQSSHLHRTIHPNEEAMFYVILLSQLSPSDKGVTRTGLFLEGQNLFYILSDMDSESTRDIPCGRISFRN